LHAVLGDELAEKSLALHLGVCSDQIAKTLLVLIFVDILAEHISDKAVVSESNVDCNLLSVERFAITHQLLSKHSLQLAKLLRMTNRA